MLVCTHKIIVFAITTPDPEPSDRREFVNNQSLPAGQIKRSLTEVWSRHNNLIQKINESNNNMRYIIATLFAESFALLSLYYLYEMVCNITIILIMFKRFNYII